MRVTAILIVILNISCMGCNKETTLLLSNLNEKIEYTGRTKKTNLATQLCYSGSSVEFTFVGHKAIVNFEDLGNGDNQHTNFLTVEINGSYDSTIELKPFKKGYNLSKLLKADTNYIKLSKRTEASVGIINFYSLEIGQNDYLIKNQPYEHKILWIGNSLTCGYGNELTIEAPPNGNPTTGFHAKNENNYYSWSSITSRKLNAESHQICYSGKGVYRNFDDSRTETLPKIFNYTFPEKSEEKWNHNNFLPELIIINLSTNDFGPEMRETPEFCDSTLFVKTYVEFVNKLLENYPKSKIVLVIGNALSDYWPQGLNRLSRSRSYINSTAINSSDKQRVNTFELTLQKPPYGEDWHPTIKTHHEMSNKIMPYIKSLMNW